MNANCFWKLFYRGSAFNSIYSQLKSLKLYTSIVYDMLHNLKKSESVNCIELWDIKRCINGGSVLNFIDFGSFSVHLQTGITQCKMYAWVSFWCHRKANGLFSYLLKYQIPRINRWFTNDTSVKRIHLKITLKQRVLDEWEHFKALLKTWRYFFDMSGYT